MGDEGSGRPSADDPAVVLTELTGRLSWHPEQLATHRRHALAATIRHAAARSPWHANRIGGIDPEELDPDDLAGLPTMTKSELMAEWDSIVTDPRLSLRSARAHLEQVDREGLSPLLGEYWVFTSGGSTGEPGIFCWALSEMIRWGISYARWVPAGEQPPPQRTAWIAARSCRHPSAAAALLSGGDPELQVPVDQPVAAIVERLNHLQPDAIAVVSSMLPPLAAAADAADLHVDLRRIVVFGDVLDRAAAARATAAFGVAPLEAYPTTDVGHIASQAPGESGLYINDDLLLVETVDEHENPVPPGAQTDHLLVTSLHQRTLPLIRYRIDDRITLDPRPGRFPAYRRIAEIDGRSDDVFDYDGLAVHPHVFRSVMSRHVDVRDYIVHQTSRGAAIQVEGPPRIATSAIREQVTEALRRAGVTGPWVEVTVVPALPRSAVGKRRNFEPLRKPTPQ